MRACVTTATKTTDSALITPSVTLYDAMGEVSYKDWNIQLNVNNVSDKEYFSACGSAICAPALPRVISGR